MNRKIFSIIQNKERYLSVKKNFTIPLEECIKTSFKKICDDKGISLNCYVRALILNEVLEAGMEIKDNSKTIKEQLGLKS